MDADKNIQLGEEFGLGNVMVRKEQKLGIGF